MKKTTASNRELHGRLRRIEGRHNALVKELRRAFARGELSTDGYCAIEGLRILEEAIRSGLRFAFGWHVLFFMERQPQTFDQGALGRLPCRDDRTRFAALEQTRE